MKESKGRKIFEIINCIILFSLAMVMVLPFVNVIALSFATSVESIQNPHMLFPKDPTLSTYNYLFSTGTILNSLGVSIYVTIVGTAINLFMTVLTAYPLSHKNLIGRSVVMKAIVFTMLFSGGMIPSFMLVHELGLIDSLWSLMIPGAISAYNLIIVKNFFQELPDELKEAARIDGAHELVILFRVVLPLSLPVLATFGLFYAVGHWNNYMNCLLYINSPSKWNIQLVLRQVVMLASGIGNDASAGEIANVIPSIGVKMATVVVATLPITIAYPFLQKYFMKGVLMGSVKG